MLENCLEQIIYMQNKEIIRSSSKDNVETAHTQLRKWIVRYLKTYFIVFAQSDILKEIKL